MTESRPTPRPLLPLGRSRLVLLPYESHGYAARENILHMLWETGTWLDTWVKGKKP